MKTSNKLLTGLLLMILLSITAFIIFAKINYNYKSIKGNGNVKSSSRNLSDFTGIDVCCGIKVNLTQGPERKVEVVADENLQSHIITKVENGILRIYTEANIRNSEQIEVNVSSPSFSFLEIGSGSEVITLGKIKGAALEIGASSSGKGDLNLEYGSLICRSSSGGNINIKGSAEKAVFEGSSGSVVHAQELLVQNCTVNNNSGASASVNVQKEIEMEANSGGRVDYSGNPVVKRLNSSSGGSINHN